LLVVDAHLPVPRITLSNPLAIQALSIALWPVLPGAVLAILLGRWAHPAPFGNILLAMLGPARRTGLALGRLIEQVDGMLPQWPAASLSLLGGGDPPWFGTDGRPMRPILASRALLQ
jgi:hypothetical protein